MRVRTVEFVKSVAKVSQVPAEPLPEVAFVGPSNVGKSTLINTLLGRKSLAKVSKTPGRTQLLNFFRVNERVFFVDLPGYGYAKVPRAVQERFLRLIEDYLAGSERLRLLCLLLDCRRTPSVRDLELKGWLDENDVPHAVVLTKADKLPRGRLKRQEALVAEFLGQGGTDVRVVPFSAKTGLGKAGLWALIDAAVGAAD